MNVLRLAVAPLLLATFAVSAQDAPRTRDEVRQELQRARAAGELSPRAEWVRGAARPKSSLTREQVQAELQAARAAGRLDMRETVARHDPRGG